VVTFLLLAVRSRAGGWATACGRLAHVGVFDLLHYDFTTRFLTTMCLRQGLLLYDFSSTFQYCFFTTVFLIRFIACS